MKRSLILLLWVILMIHNILVAQIRLDFDVLSIDDGFTSSRANTIIQDQKGFIWVGTWNGLNRFDGYKCEVYQPGYRDSSSLSNREVTALLEDREGSIWIGTTFGLNRLNPITNKIDVFPFEYRILSLFEDRQGKIWVGTLDDGLYWFDKKTGEKHHCIKNETIHSIYEDSRHLFWIATSNGLIDLDRETNNYNRYLLSRKQNTGELKNEISVSSIVETSNGNIWVGTSSEGIIKITPNQNKNKHEIQYYNQVEGGGYISSYPTQKLFVDQSNNIWVGTWGGGLFMLSPKEQIKAPETARFLICKNDINDPFSISGNNYISSIFVDRSNTLWVGTSLLNIANIGNIGMVRFNTREIIDNKIVNNWVRTITGNNHGTLWLGSSDGLKRIDLRSKQNQVVKMISEISYTYNGNPYRATSFLSFLNQHQGYFWIATEGAGLILFPEKEMNKEKLGKNYIFMNEETHKNMPGNQISTLTASKKIKNVTWVGTPNQGFAECYNNSGSFSFKKYKAGHTDKELTDNNIRAVLEDKKGLVWIGTQHGLNCFNPETKTFDHYYYSSTDTTSLNDNAINVIFEDSNGDLWIGSNAGLNKKIEENGKILFKPYPKFDRIDSDIILNILEDDHKNLWISIYNGIVKFNLKQEEVINEYFDKGYQRIKIDHNSSWKGADGRFYLGGGTGFLSFHPDSFLINEPAVNVQITDFLVFNKSVIPNQKINGKIILSKSISYTDSLKLSFRDEVFTFVFSSMNFRSPDKSSYAYRLKGFDKDWNMVGQRNTATYTKIPPGHYIFEVKACNSQGDWESEVKSIHIQVVPPWWKTIFAYVFYMVLIIVILDILIRYSILRVKEKSRLELERVHMEKEHELNELKVHFFTNITHEFRTPLTLIIGPLDEMIQNKNTFGTYGKNLELMNRNAHRLLRLINQLMEFRKVEKGKMELLLQEADIIPIINEIHDSFSSMAQSKNIDFTLKYDLPSLKAWIDRDKFDKVMYNILSNAFKFTEEGGKISIKVGSEIKNTEIHSYYIEIEDSGIGIPADKIDFIFERFYQINQKSTQSTGGIGLYLSKAFIELHHGKIEVISEEMKGSCFRIELPCNYKDLESSMDYSTDVTYNIDDINNEQTKLDSSLETIETTLIDPHRSTILLVEDDVDMNEFISRSLSDSFKIIRTYNGREALDIARKINPDIVISDVMMPEMDGIELCSNLQNDINTSHIPILFLTAKTTQDNEIEGLRLGAVDYIYKPFSITSLRLKIMNILSYRASLHHNFRKNTLLEPEAITLTSIDDQFLKSAVDSVQNHLDNPDFDVEMLSHGLGMSSNQTYRKIKALTGQTAKEFIRNQRLKTAAQLLAQRKRNVQEIIYMVGFSSASYFTKCFKEYFGCTPSEYADQNENINTN